MRWGAAFGVLALMGALSAAEVEFRDTPPFAPIEGADPGDLSERLRSYLIDHAGAAIDRNYVWILAKLGLTLQEISLRRSAPSSSMREEALEHLQSAVELAEQLDIGIGDDMKYFWRLRLSVLLHSMGRPEEALNAAEQSLELARTDDDKSTALYHMGDNLVMLGDLHKALEKFQDALQLTPHRLTMYRDIVRCHKQLKDLRPLDWYALLEEVESAFRLSQQHNTVEPGNEVLWVLHEIAEAAELYSEAWRHLSQARAAEVERRAGWGEVYDSAAVGAKVALLQKVFHEGFWPDPAASVGSRSMLPVFVVGLPRSGSTLLESILTAHKDVSTVREDSALAASVVLLQEEERALREMFLAAGGDVDIAASALATPVKGKFKEAYASAWRNLIKVHADNITDIMRAEAESITGLKAPKRIIDKLLANYRNIGIIHLLFPKATILHIYRDPRDTILSLMKHNFAHPSLGWTLKDGDVLQEYTQYISLMNHFSEVLPHGRIVDVRYESLVAQPEKTLQHIFNKIGVKWDSEVLTLFHKLKKPYILTPSFLQIRECIHDRSIGVWRKYTSEPAYRVLVARLKSLIDDSNRASAAKRKKTFFDTTSWTEEFTIAVLPTQVGSNVMQSS